MSDEYKKFDSQVTVIWHNVRLAKDPEVVQFNDGELVKLTAVMTSRSARNADVWYTIEPRKFDADKGKFLRKNDTVSVEGFPTAREWTNKAGQIKLSHSIEQAKIIIPPSLFAALKERRWTPGEKTAATPPAKAKPIKTTKVAIVDPDDTDGDLF